MTTFTPNNSKWGAKINFVDSNNRAVGFDMRTCCCEDFGWAFCEDAPKVAEDHKQGLDASAYLFVDEPYTLDANPYDEGGTIYFRMEAEGLPDLYLAIWNHHNGYYSHGFTSWLGDGGL